jgi:hypothetical protein
MLGCPQCQKHEPRSLFPENSALSPDSRRVALHISNQKANNLDPWIESFDGASNARFPLDFGAGSSDPIPLEWRGNRKLSGPEVLVLYQKRPQRRDWVA